MHYLMLKLVLLTSPGCEKRYRPYEKDTILSASTINMSDLTIPIFYSILTGWGYTCVCLVDHFSPPTPNCFNYTPCQWSDRSLEKTFGPLWRGRIVASIYLFPYGMTARRNK